MTFALTENNKLTPEKNFFPQGSVLGPLLFSIYIYGYIFLTSNIDVASYADDTAAYIYEGNISSTMESLEEASDFLS